MCLQLHGTSQSHTIASCCLILTLTALALCGGCTDTAPPDMTDSDITVISDTDTPTPTSSYGRQVFGNIVLDIPEFVQHWNPDGRCYWEGRISVTNTGTEPERNVIIRSTLYRTSDNGKEQVHSKSLTRVNPDEPLSYVVQLYGECDEDYYIIVTADTE